MKDKLKTIIVDDEPDAILVLKTMIQDFCDDVEVVGIAGNAIQAIKLIKERRPDVLFLDVEMPGGTGFDLLEAIGEPKPQVIFITAYNRHAIKAIRSNALDYLLKPVDVDELRAAVKKAAEKAGKTDRELKTSVIRLCGQEGIVLTEIRDIIYIKGEGRYSTVSFTDGKKVLVVKNLKEFEDELAGNFFYRVHKSHLVNCNHVKKIANKDGGFIELSNGESVEVSRRKKSDFLGFLSRKK
jgi:two-component system, LytTR family, response regulator